MVFNHGIHRIYGMIVSVVLLLLVRSSFAATWYVDAAKGDDENSGASWNSALVTIQRAIDISSDGDTVVVGDGIYDSIDAKNKRIIIRSKNGFKSTVIDGRKTSRCFVGGGGSISSKPCTTLEGFTLCNGNAQVGLSTMGGASVGGLLVNCLLQNNNAHYNAGAAWYSEMENCLITGSTVDSNGGAYCTVVYQCTLRNCTIVNNRCSRGTSVAYGSNLYNCIVYDNSPNAIQVTQQEVKNCYTSDPLFVDVDSGDYRLKKASPCIDAGSNSYSSTVADLAGKARIYNGTVDIGAYEYSPNVFSISSVTAAQRYPWNGLVDLKFTITGESGTKYDTSFTAKDMVGGTNIAMKTIRKSDGTTAAEKEKLLPGTYNWVWDAAADLPKDFKCERMTVEVTADEIGFPSVVEGLVAWWPFDSSIQDKSGNGHHLSGETPMWTTNRKGNPGSAADFSGTLILSQTTNLNVAENMSFVCWVKPSVALNLPSWIGINLGCGNYGIDNRGFPIVILPVTGDSLNSGIGFSVATDRCNVLARANDSTGMRNDPCVIMDCKCDLSSGWHHVAITINNNGKPILYVDGEMKTVKATTVNGKYYISNESAIGGGDFALSEGLGYGKTIYKGGLDDLCIYNRALTESEVKSLYNSSK